MSMSGFSQIPAGNKIRPSALNSPILRKSVSGKKNMSGVWFRFPKSFSARQALDNYRDTGLMIGRLNVNYLTFFRGK